MTDFTETKKVINDCVKIVLKQANYLLEVEGRMQRQKYFIIELYFINPCSFAFAKKFIYKKSAEKYFQKLVKQYI